MRIVDVSSSWLAAVLLLAPASGCVVGSDAEVEVKISEIVTRYPSYPLINAAPYRSSLGAFDVNVYVDRDAMAAYSAIDPGRSGSHAVLPPGTVIVRTVMNDQHAVGKLTLMVKGAPGANPTCGDWWFGVTDPSGKVLDDSAGMVQAGPLATCESCHVTRATDDYVFGVPSADRS